MSNILSFSYILPFTEDDLLKDYQIQVPRVTTELCKSLILLHFLSSCVDLILLYMVSFSPILLKNFCYYVILSKLLISTLNTERTWQPK